MTCFELSYHQFYSHHSLFAPYSRGSDKMKMKRSVKILYIVRTAYLTAALIVTIKQFQTVR